MKHVGGILNIKAFQHFIHYKLINTACNQKTHPVEIIKQQQRKNSFFQTPPASDMTIGQYDCRRCHIPSPTRNMRAQAHKHVDHCKNPRKNRFPFPSFQSEKNIPYHQKENRLQKCKIQIAETAECFISRPAHLPSSARYARYAFTKS